MIESLAIDDLGVIEHADFSFSPRLTALTGETGAGKTMILSSVALLMGARSETSIVRAGAEKAVIEGRWLINDNSAAAQRALEAGAALDDDELICVRMVPSEGRSRAVAGGRSVPSSVLADICSDLITIHGQADQIRLRSQSAQRRAVDNSGGQSHLDLCRNYAQAWKKLTAARTELKERTHSVAQRQARAAQLRLMIDMVEEAQLQPGEDEELTHEVERLSWVDDLRQATTQALAALRGGEETTSIDQEQDAQTLLGNAVRYLEHACHYDSALDAVTEQLGALTSQISDITDEIVSYTAGLNADPQRLEEVFQRRALIARTLKELAAASLQPMDHTDDALQFVAAAREELADLNNPDNGPEQAQRNVDAAYAEVVRFGDELTASRQRIAATMEEKVAEELHGLFMPGARVHISLDELDDYGPTGKENVALLLQPHPGAEPLPLGKGASGGELSRVMLAIELVLADTRAQHTENTSYPTTMIFDEIDAGVGGKAAGAIGQRLARLAQHHQVIVVTHLPQVAAWADRHLVVEKTVGDTSTTTRVHHVVDEYRQRELARMLSGHDDSDTALRHAVELLREATVAECHS
ncbi:DNA repair protein RecN [Actinomyces vulturis]|uniref:DNA repair protein RecN n=1 Tax=Actinomyces vulturis TaxID=1857645 RepID=UPI00082982CF|nr:DNA repair protein RecN [Actinomyces vulturis]